MTHPDIIRVENTGYPDVRTAMQTGNWSNYFEETLGKMLFGKNECILCGELSQLDENRHCEYCKPVTCTSCGVDSPADDTYSGICHDCVKTQANDNCVAMAYILHCFEELPRRMSEYCLDDESHFADWLAKRETDNQRKETRYRIGDRAEHNTDNFFGGLFSGIEESLARIAIRADGAV